MSQTRENKFCGKNKQYWQRERKKSYKRREGGRKWERCIMLPMRQEKNKPRGILAGPVPLIILHRNTGTKSVLINPAFIPSASFLLKPKNKSINWFVHEVISKLMAFDIRWVQYFITGKQYCRFWREKISFHLKRTKRTNVRMWGQYDRGNMAHYVPCASLPWLRKLSQNRKQSWCNVYTKQSCFGFT